MISSLNLNAIHTVTYVILYTIKLQIIPQFSHVHIFFFVMQGRHSRISASSPVTLSCSYFSFSCLCFQLQYLLCCKLFHLKVLFSLPEALVLHICSLPMNDYKPMLYKHALGERLIGICLSCLVFHCWCANVKTGAQGLPVLYRMA